jgi:hypothetical protein
MLKKLNNRQISLFYIINTYGKNAYKLHLTLKTSTYEPIKTKGKQE